MQEAKKALSKAHTLPMGFDGKATIVAVMIRGLPEANSDLVCRNFQFHSGSFVCSSVCQLSFILKR